MPNLSTTAPQKAARSSTENRWSAGYPSTPTDAAKAVTFAAAIVAASGVHAGAEFGAISESGA